MVRLQFTPMQYDVNNRSLVGISLAEYTKIDPDQLPKARVTPPAV